MTDLTGGCLCGAIRFHVSGEPLCVSHCHCTFCRRATGAAFIAWMTLASGHYRITRGGPAVYRSTPAVRRSFCSRCGTTLSYAHDDHPEEVDVAAAALDDQDRVVPDDHIMVTTMVPWLEFGDDLPRLPEGHWEVGYPDRDGR